ncbi:MAG: transposase family protein [Paenibacillaceae bacterium]|jgi:hypothetical protein|nr:transposase family protein [Paenibacillaceae bacterium]
MEAILENCCGLDVHRDTVVACLLTGHLEDRPKKEIRTFSTMSKGLHELGAWLQSASCTHVAMESTGVYWKPVYQVLEESCELCCGLIEGSFVPPEDIRELRDLTRYRKKMVNHASAEKNRIQKVLESAGIKLASVIYDVFGVTGRSILNQLMDQGKLEEDTVRSLVKGQIKNKVPQLMDAKTGKAVRFIPLPHRCN